MSRSRGGLFKLGFQGIGFYCLGIRLGGMMFTNPPLLFLLFVTDGCGLGISHQAKL